MNLDNLKARAAKNAEEARNESPRLVVGTEPVKPPPTIIKPKSNTKTSKKLGQSYLDDLKNSL